MFRALSEITGSTDPNSVTPNNFPSVQSHLYNTALPNFTPVGSAAKQDYLLSHGLNPLLTVDPNTRQPTQRDLLLRNYPMTLDVPKSIITNNDRCANTSLDSLIGSTNLEETIRCGWIYQKGLSTTPAVSKGAIGTRDGPVNVSGVTQPEGKWYWNLDAAKKQIAADTCKAIRLKSDLPTVSGICEWDNVKGTAVPIGTATQKPARSRDICEPLPNGTLSRDCVMQRITSAGCAQGGALQVALQSKSEPNDYAAGLRQLPSFIEYQRKSRTPIADSVIRNGAATTQYALQTFQQVANQTSGSTSLNAAARDLCLTKGTYDQFDFCSDYTASTPGPFDLKCLQKAWANMGGSSAGSMYPNAATLGSWNSRFSTWGQVTQFITKLSVDINSSNNNLQADALDKLIGIKRKEKKKSQIDRLQGAEVFWINLSDNSFIGRRVHVNASNSARDLMPSFLNYGSEIEKTGQSGNIMFMAFTNMRPPTDTSIRMGMQTSDGTVIVLNNNNFDPYGSRGIRYTASELAAYIDQSPTQYLNNQCWSLTAEGPNYVTTFWEKGSGTSSFKMYYSNCADQNKMSIPESWFTLTQEVDAPMISFDVQMNGTSYVWRELRMPFVLPSGPVGSASLRPTTFTDIPSIHQAGVQLGNNGAITFSKPMSMNSWRTITIAFRLNNVAANSRKLFTMGSLGITITNNIIAFGCNSISGQTILKQSLNMANTYLLVINQRSDYQQTYPNRLTVACASISDWSRGVATMSDPSYSSSRTTTDNANLFNKTDNFNPFVGDSYSSPDVTVAWVHFFDQELTSDMCGREAKMNWARAFVP